MKVRVLSDKKNDITKKIITKYYDLIIIGAGPAGLTAAIYASRSKLNVLVIDEATAGGQVKTTHQVANYPGFIEPISGYQLASNMQKQAEKYGTQFKLISDIIELDLKSDLKNVTIDSGENFESKYVIIATGRSPRLLEIPGEAELTGSGISYCATCDGDFYKDKDVFVIGGGNSAMEESLLLLQHVKSLRIIHQFDHLQAEKILGDKVLSNKKVSILWSHEPRSFSYNDNRVSIEVENLKTQNSFTETRDGVFIFVGMVPNNNILSDTDIQLNEHGYIPVNELSMETNLPNVYAIGDIRDKHHWQITTAVSDGTIAALDIIKKF